MRTLDAAGPLPIRADLAAAQARAWARLAGPGTWWDGAERIAIAAETRHAPSCELCRRRNESISPGAIEGRHDSLGDLPRSVVEVVHRVCTDPGRLGETWFRDVIASGLSTRWRAASVSTRRRCPRRGRAPPSRRRPAGARPGGAWVAWLEPTDLGEAEAGLYPAPGVPVANIRKAMSLVPDEAKSFFDLVSHQYQGPLEMRDFAREYRAINHAQIELLAARVSALNQCLY